MSIKPARTPQQPTEPLFAGQSCEYPNPDDFVDDVLAIVRALVPGLGADVCAKACAAIRERWGGDRPYIARRAGEGRSGRNEAIRRDYQRGERLALLERRYAISQRHILRIIKSD
jgi:Mor family transcriptional regulator